MDARESSQNQKGVDPIPKCAVQSKVVETILPMFLSPEQRELDGKYDTRLSSIADENLDLIDDH
jgi:hypothetical protein